MNELDRHQRLYIAAKAEQLRLGKISRRQFIRAAALAGFGISCGRYLSGYTRAMSGTEVTTATTRIIATDSKDLTPQQRFLKDVGGRFKGTKIRIVSENTP